MVVKSERGRRRYIGFRVSESFVKETLIAKLRSLASPEDTPYVIQCSKGWAVVRCAPGDREKTISLMRSADPTSESILTSGTLRALRSAVPELEETRPPARK